MNNEFQVDRVLSRESLFQKILTLVVPCLLVLNPTLRVIFGPAYFVQYKMAELFCRNHIFVEFPIVAVNPTWDISSILPRFQPEQLLSNELLHLLILEVEELCQFSAVQELLIFHVLGRLDVLEYT